MKCLLQRVSEACVRVDGVKVGEISAGLLVFVGLERDDTPAMLERMADRLLSYRVFADQDDKMNLNVADISGGVLLVSQFTLAADTRKGKRPSFSSAAPPDVAQPMFERFVELVAQRHPDVATGTFGADMKIALVNDGPVTFMLSS